MLLLLFDVRWRSPPGLIVTMDTVQVEVKEWWRGRGGGGGGGGAGGGGSGGGAGGGGAGGGGS